MPPGIGNPDVEAGLCRPNGRGDINFLVIPGGAPPRRERTRTPKKLISPEPAGPRRPASTSALPGPGGTRLPRLVAAARRGAERRGRPSWGSAIFALFDREKINNVKTNRGVLSLFGRHVPLRVPQHVFEAGVDRTVGFGDINFLVGLKRRKKQVFGNWRASPAELGRAAVTRLGTKLAPGPGRVVVEAGRRGPDGSRDMAVSVERVRCWGGFQKHSTGEESALR